MSNRFNIGDKVYLAAYERKAIMVTCPDCFGSKRVRVILGDDTEISIECGGCYPGGYDPSLGYITNYEWTASAKLKTVTGVEERAGEPTRYNFGNTCDFDGNKTFATEEEALTKANELRQAYEDEENKRLMAKTKNARSWAWNATYHRQCAERARKELAYHEDKARICAARKKVVHETDPGKQDTN